jgi:hypothetical protein
MLPNSSNNGANNRQPNNGGSQPKPPSQSDLVQKRVQERVEQVQRNPNRK